MKVKKITLISTSLGTGGLMHRLFVKEFPGVDVRNIVDDNLVREILSNKNTIPPHVVRSVCSYVVSAEMSGSDLIVITCSSIAGLTKVAERLVKIPVMRIDGLMVELAVKKAHRLKILATIPATLTPTVELIQEKARETGKMIEIDATLCENARRSLDEGRPEEHDRLLCEEIGKALDRFDFVLLAQASMARVLDTLEEGKRKQVLTSPPLAVEEVRRRYF
jgi:hypothetical protein